MIQTSVESAENNLAQLIEKAVAGEEVIIQSENKQIKLVPVRTQTADWFGMDAGKGWIADDFDNDNEDLIAAFYGDNEK